MIPAANVENHTDPFTGKDVIAGCVRIRKKGETAWLKLPGLLPRMLGLGEKELALGWHVLPGARDLILPRGELEMEAFAGILSPLAKLTMDLKGLETLEVDVPLWPGKLDGWVAGNTHVHLKTVTREDADRYLVEVAQADRLQAVFLSYLERAIVDRDYTSNLYTDEDLKRLSTPNVVFGNGEEYRHNIGAGGEGYGHVLLLNLTQRILPASLGPGITQQGDDGTPLRAGLEQARADAATIIWCHNKFGHEDIPSWLAGLVDAQNVFDGGSYGGYEDTYYRYLNLGLRVPFSTGTDWFIYDFSRVYVPMDSRVPLTAANWLKALRSGHSVITNGPWIDFLIDGIEAGGTVNLPQPRTVRLRAEVTGRANFGKLEIVQNGKVVASVNAAERPGTELRPILAARATDLGNVLQGNGASYQASLHLPEFQVDGPCWIAARITPPDDAVNEFGQKPFAHTSPVYLEVAGKSVFIPETAAQVRAALNADVEAVIQAGQFTDSGQKFALRQLYEEALEALAELEKDAAAK